MKKVDVAIVGAGPGGATAAHRLAQAGLKVVLMDQEVFPRPKTCGDLMTTAGLECLARTGLETWSASFTPIGPLLFSSPAGEVLNVSVKGKNGSVVGRIIPRIKLDHQVVQAAVKAGAELLDGCRVETVDRLPDKVQVNTADEPLEAGMLILADGSRAPVTRKLGLVKAEFDLWAVQQYLEGDSFSQAPIEFHFQPIILPGYTWLIPMGDGRVNIGAGTYTRRVRNKEVNLPQVLERLKMDHPTQKDRLKGCCALSAIRAHPLRTDLNQTKTHADRILVVGDAAGLVSPFTGEGIASAMVSGELAAQQVLLAFEKGDFTSTMLSAYTRQLRNRYGYDKKVARFLRSTLKFPVLLNRVIHKMVKRSDKAELFGQIFMDELPSRELIKPKILLDLLA